MPEAFCAPDTVAVYVVEPASEFVGVNVATVSAALNPTDPATLFPAESLTVNDTVPGVTGWENVADGATDQPATAVTPDDLGETLLQGRYVQWPFDPDRGRQVVLCAGRIKLLQEPQPLLRIGQRRGAASVRPRRNP